MALYSILLLEEDASERRFFEEFVATNGLPYALAMADSLDAGLEILRHGGVDAVITDYVFEGGDVFDLLRATPHVPVIIATAHGDEDVAVQAMKDGAFDYLIKDDELNYLAKIPLTVERAVAQGRLRAQGRLLEHAVMAIHDAVYITDANGRIIFVNTAFVETYGYTREEAEGMHASLLDETLPTCPQRGKGSPSRGSLETAHQRRDGAVFPVSITCTRLPSEHGAPEAVVWVARDISHWREAEEQLKSSLSEKEVLLREVHHRVKNNLQVVSSLLNLQAGYVKDEQTQDVLRDSQNRVKSMALIHERLYRSDSLKRIDFREYVQNLAHHVRSSYGALSGVNVRLEMAPLLMDVDMAIPCGLILNELISNALKHGYPKGGPGEVRIRVWTEPELHSAGEAAPVSRTPQGEGECRLHMMVEDDGPGFQHPRHDEITPENAETLGLQLASTLAQQLRGAFVLETPAHGARALLDIPMDVCQT